MQALLSMPTQPGIQQGACAGGNQANDDCQEENMLTGIPENVQIARQIAGGESVADAPALNILSAADQGHIACRTRMKRGFVHIHWQ